MTINKSFRALEILDHREGDKMLQARKLRPINPAMKEHAVKRIHRVLALLQPVAWRMNRVGDHLVPLDIETIKDWKFRLLIRWPHVGKHQTFVLVNRVRPVTNLLFDVAVGRLPGRIENRPIRVKLPPVIRTPDPVLFNPAVLK